MQFGFLRLEDIPAESWGCKNRVSRKGIIFQKGSAIQGEEGLPFGFMYLFIFI
jgi:hypothetical protein